MTRVQVYDVGTLGIMKETDVPFHTIPPEAWSDGLNVRFRDKKAIKFSGHDNVFSQSIIAGYWLLSVPSGSSNFWINAGLENVEAIQTTLQATITRGAGVYSAASLGRWNGGVLGNIAILNNGQDIPQYWATASVSQLLQNMTNWPADYRAKVIRPFKNFLVAMGITVDFNLITEVVYPNRYITSQPCDPGAIPNSWDATDETKDVIDSQFSDSEAGGILDGMELGDNFIMYKQGSTWLAQYVGGVFINKFVKIFDSHGILCTNCVAPMAEGKGHFVFTGDDLIIHDGQTVTSVANERMRQYIKDNIDADNFYRSFCVANNAAKEMWFCFPEVGSTYASIAVVYNVVSKQLSLRQLSNVAHIAAGFVDEAGAQEIWDNVTDVWDDMLNPWDAQVTTQYSRGLLGTDPTQTKLFRFDNTELFDGSNMNCFLERKGIAIIGRDRQGQPQLDFTRNKIIQRIWPKMSGGPVSIKVGTQDFIDGPVTWSTAQTFDPATDQYLDPDPPPNGRLPAVRIDSIGALSWNISGYDLEMDVIGVI